MLRSIFATSQFGPFKINFLLIWYLKWPVALEFLTIECLSVRFGDAAGDFLSLALELFFPDLLPRRPTFLIAILDPEFSSLRRQRRTHIPP